MTQVLASDLGGCHALSDPACASACHATGEPGTEDGGFSQVVAELGLPMLPADYDDLPQALRRLGGVGCLACHGPTKIPDLSERPLLMSNDVCAVCHDAPPRYGHVQALESSRMAHADSSPAVRNNPECARCHTSWGALGRPAPAPESSGFGISCATCHDVHPHGPGARAGAAAHEATDAGQPRRTAPRFRAARDAPRSSGVVSGAEPALCGLSRAQLQHLAAGGQRGRDRGRAGRLGAGNRRRAGPSGAARGLRQRLFELPRFGARAAAAGKSHGFRAAPAGCARCHDSPPARDPSLGERARLLLARLDPKHSSGGASMPWHASYQVLLRTPQQTRALRNVLLVLEDPAADVHHPSYARALLDSAERLAPGTQR